MSEHERWLERWPCPRCSAEPPQEMTLLRSKSDAAQNLEVSATRAVEAEERDGVAYGPWHMTCAECGWSVHDSTAGSTVATWADLSKMVHGDAAEGPDGK